MKILSKSVRQNMKGPDREFYGPEFLGRLRRKWSNGTFGTQDQARYGIERTGEVAATAKVAAGAAQYGVLTQL